MLIYATAVVLSIKIPTKSVIIFYKRVVIPGKLHSVQDSL